MRGFLEVLRWALRKRANNRERGGREAAGLGEDSA